MLCHWSFISFSKEKTPLCHFVVVIFRSLLCHHPYLPNRVVNTVRNTLKSSAGIFFIRSLRKGDKYLGELRLFERISFQDMTSNICQILSTKRWKLRLQVLTRTRLIKSWKVSIFQFWHYESWIDMTHLKSMSSIKWVFNFDEYNRILKLLFGRHLATYDFENRQSLGMSQVIHDWREAIKVDFILLLKSWSSQKMHFSQVSTAAWFAWLWKTLVSRITIMFFFCKT